MMRKIFSLVAVVLVGCVASVAGDNPAVGKWNCVSDDGHGAVLQWVLSLSEKEGKLSGTIEEGGMSMPLIDPTFAGKDLTFKTFINPNCTVKYALKLDKDKLEGTFACTEVSGTFKGVKKQG